MDQREEDLGVQEDQEGQEDQEDQVGMGPAGKTVDQEETASDPAGKSMGDWSQVAVERRQQRQEKDEIAGVAC